MMYSSFKSSFKLSYNIVKIYHPKKRSNRILYNSYLNRFEKERNIQKYKLQKSIKKLKYYKDPNNCENSKCRNH